MVPSNNRTFILLIGLLLITRPAAAVSAQTPVEQTGLLLASVRELMTLKSRSEQEACLHHIFESQIDFDKFLERSLSDQRATLTPEEIQKFRLAFRQTLERKIFSKLKKLQQFPSHFQFKVLKEEPSLACVRASSIYHKTTLNLDFFLIERDGAWRLFDLSINKANLTENYQAQFNRIIRTEGFQNLLARLEKKR